jgi:hypothetical protein
MHSIAEHDPFFEKANLLLPLVFFQPLQPSANTIKVFTVMAPPAEHTNSTVAPPTVSPRRKGRLYHFSGTGE